MFKKLARVISVVTLAAMVTVMFAGCNKSAQGSSAKKGTKFGLTMKELDNPYFVQLKDAIKAAMKPGDTLVVCDEQQDEGKQINDVDDMIQQGCKVIFINAIDSKGVKPALEACKKAGVIAIAVDTAVYDTGLVATTVASDNYQAGVLAGQALATKLNGQGNIALYEHPSSLPSKQRVDGFESVIKTYPNMKIVNRQSGAGKIDLALTAMENMLQATPNINGVFAINDPAGIGCISAIEGAKKTGISVVCVDGSADGFKKVKSGELLGTAAQFPAEIGKESVDCAYKLVAGQTVDKDVKVAVKFVDSSNVDQYAK